MRIVSSPLDQRGSLIFVINLFFYFFKKIKKMNQNIGSVIYSIFNEAAYFSKRLFLEIKGEYDEYWI